MFSSIAELDIAKFAEADATLLDVNVLHSIIVIDDSERVNSRRFIVSDTVEPEKNTDLFLVNNMYAHYSLSEGDHLTAEIVASLLSGKAVGSDKSRQTFETLLANLTANELELGS